MHAVEGEQDHDHEVGDEQGGIEGIPLIEIAERIVDRIVAVMRAQVMANAALRKKPEPGIRGCVLEEGCKLD
jgi:hypothetical protein